MTPEEFTEAVREETKTELSRLGSSKSLYADTRGEMEEETVLAAAADALGAAAATFEGWAENEDHEGPRECFDAAADAVGDHYDTVAGKLDAHDPGDPSAIDEYLRGLDATVARVGGLVGWALATEKKSGQLTGFFVGQADPRTSQVFRDANGDVESLGERAADLLAECCGDEADWDRAREAATGAVEAAYDEYFETLEALGVNPKPVC